MVRYPYSLWVLTPAAASTKNTDGDTVAGFLSWVKVSACRNESNGKAATIMLADGKTYVYDSVVFLPLGAPAIAINSSVEVRNATGGVRVSGIVNRFTADQLGSRLWV